MSCQLCEAPDSLTDRPVAPREDTITVCTTCSAGIDGELGDPAHWFCLQGSIWSEHPAVQVVSYRLLKQLAEPWATDLLDQAYLDEDTLAWARALDDAPGAAPTLDSHGTPLADGDAVTLIKDLDVKGANFTAKRGTLVKNIRLTDDPGLVEGKVNKTSIYLKTEFLKRA